MSVPRPVQAEERDRTVPIAAEHHRAGPLWLRVESAPGLVTAVLAPGAALVLGSGHDADVRIDDRTVSARHCRVSHQGAGVLVEDLGSTNGVRAGGARVSQAVVSAGARFEIGRTSVVVDPEPLEAPRRAAPLRGLVGASVPMCRLAAEVREAARLRLPVLVRGESGTGKDLVARALHEEGPRRGKPFVALNAAAISRELAESELFGHERGAFTGAARDRKGAFREASGGTLFLDEIGAVPLDLQTKLLRVVEEGSVRAVGAEASQRVDVRLVAATCEPLEAMVAGRAFRADLYERLAVCVLRVPPLRERPQDLAAIAEHLLAHAEVGHRELSEGALGLLRAQRWPGNVRELRNVLVQAALRVSGRIHAADVAEVLAARTRAGRHRVGPGEALRIYEEAGRNVSAAARRAQLPRSTMRDLLRAAGRPALERPLDTTAVPPPGALRTSR
jgi:DNA-binding NtrC family response regulator